jgi:hypothetical protein
VPARPQASSRRATTPVGDGRESSPAQLEYRGQEFGDLRTNHRKDLLALTNRVGDVRRLVGQMRAKRREVGDMPCVAFLYEEGGLTQREGSVESVRGTFQNSIAMRHRHGENKIGVGSNSRGELPSTELGRVTAQLRQHECGVVVNRMPDHGTDAGAGCPEVRDLKSGGIYSGKSLRRRRSTNVSSANE